MSDNIDFAVRNADDVEEQSVENRREGNDSNASGVVNENEGQSEQTGPSSRLNHDPQPTLAEAKLAPCPDSPNCVSTLADDEEHGIEPIAYHGTAEEATRALLGVIESMPRTTLEVQQEDYFHYTVRSLVFRFVDDVEFVVDRDANLIHFRSASRLGYSDLGVNRRRMEKVRAEFLRTQA